MSKNPVEFLKDLAVTSLELAYGQCETITSISELTKLILDRSTLDDNAKNKIHKELNKAINEQIKNKEIANNLLNVLKDI